MAISPCTFPYVPGLLTFREGPILLEAIRRLHRRPDVIMFDGQGIAHPRRFGLASHLGLILNVPTVGCAKSCLTGHFIGPGPSKGSWSPLIDRGETIGAVVRTREKVTPVFVSPGHMIDLQGAIEVVLNCCTRYREPEPIRWAHQRSRSLVMKQRR
jgi:deoxyribonuclease V